MIGPDELLTSDGQAIKWLWPGYIPRRGITLLEGNPGIGKSLLVDELAKRVAGGHKQFFSDAFFEPERVVYLGQPKNDQTGNISRYFAGEWSLDRHTLYGHMEVADLVICDPLSTYMDSSDYSHRRVRRALADVADAAADAGVAVVVTVNRLRNQLPKWQYEDGPLTLLPEIMAGLMLFRRPELGSRTRRALAVTKAAGMYPAPARVFEVHRAGGGDYIFEHGTWQVNGYDLLERPKPGMPSYALDDAVQFLQEMLEDGPVPVTEIETIAGQVGISRRTLSRARRELGVVARRSGFGRGGGWVLSY